MAIVVVIWGEIENHLQIIQSMIMSTMKCCLSNCIIGYIYDGITKYPLNDIYIYINKGLPSRTMNESFSCEKTPFSRGKIHVHKTKEDHARAITSIIIKHKLSY